MPKFLPSLLFGLVSLSAAAVAADDSRPKTLRAVIDCRSNADNAARLACFDKTVAQLDVATNAREVIVVDQTEVRKARKGLFGVAIPDLGLFRSSNKADEQGEGFTFIESTIKSAFQRRDGKWVIMIEDGAQWLQIDSEDVQTPRPKQPIRIRRAAMGTYLANINKQTAIRVKREN